MCHINVIKRKDEMPDRMINRYMDIVSLYSFASNSDGEGYIGMTGNSVKVDRSLNKIRYAPLKDFHMLMTHQRLSTSGFNLNNTHPHEGQYFIIQHNGVFSGMGDKDKSDTRCYLEILEKSYEKSNDVITSIKESVKGMGGSFSIILFDKKTMKTYYYKNRVTNMYKLDCKRYIIMSTSEQNLKVAKIFFNIKGNIKEVNDNNIYEVCSEGLKYITKLGLEVYKDKYYNWGGINSDWTKKVDSRNWDKVLNDTRDLIEYQDDAEKEQEKHKLNEWGWPVDY